MKRLFLLAVVLMAIGLSTSAQMVGPTNNQPVLREKKTHNSPLYRPEGSSIRLSVGFPTYASVAYNYQIKPYFMLGAGIGFGLKAYDEDVYNLGEYRRTNVNSEGCGFPIYLETEIRTPRYKWSVFMNLRIGINIGDANIPSNHFDTWNEANYLVYVPRNLYFVATGGISYKNLNLGLGWANLNTVAIVLSYNYMF